jgi:hypothetical protein
MSNNWLHKIRSHQATPPESAWLNIANELDKDNETVAVDVTTKMLAFEVAPPAAALSNIFATLDKEEAESTTTFANRMYNYQQEAPAGTWKNIVTELDKSEAIIVPLTNNKKNLKAIYFRMAAAASVIAVIATTIWLSSKTDTPTSNNPIASVTPEIKNPAKVIETPNVKEKTTSLPASDSQEKKLTPEETNLAQTTVKKTNPLPVTNAPAYVKGNDVNDLAPDPVAANKEKLQNTTGQTPNDIALMNTPSNTYISITGPDGQSVRVSSKFSNLLSELTTSDTQENIDVIISQSAQWRKIFTEWREKMTNNTVAPSFTNFLDIISLSEILEAKK